MTSIRVGIAGTSLAGMEASAERTGMYSQRLVEVILTIRLLRCG